MGLHVHSRTPAKSCILPVKAASFGMSLLIHSIKSTVSGSQNSLKSSSSLFISSLWVCRRHIMTKTTITCFKNDVTTELTELFLSLDEKSFVGRSFCFFPLSLEALFSDFVSLWTSFEVAKLWSFSTNATQISWSATAQAANIQTYGVQRHWNLLVVNARIPKTMDWPRKNKNTTHQDNIKSINDFELDTIQRLFKAYIYEKTASAFHPYVLQSAILC